MNIQEIHIDKFPVVIFTDPHTNLSNIKKLKELYPDSRFICLGDFCFLFAKEGEKFNEYSIQYFIDNKIPALEGNHEQFIANSEEGNGFTLERVKGKISEFNLKPEHLQFLENLPRGFKLILPNGLNYYCFHNQPKDLWGFPDNITESDFKSSYIFDNKSLGVICGHLHLNKIDNFNPKRYVIGQLCGSDHHTGDKNGGNYILLTKDGIEYKKI